MRSLLEKAASTTGVTGVILAGGQSSRMGSNKALLPYRGGRFIESIHSTLSGMFDEVILITNTPEQYGFLDCAKFSDHFYGMGALAGLHSALLHSPTEHIFVVACDMPYLNTDIIKALLARRAQSHVVIPESEHGMEPLHAVYSRSCLPFMEAALQAGRRRIVSFFDHVSVSTLDKYAISTIDPGFNSFKNINTPTDYFHLRSHERTPSLPFDIALNQ